MKAGAAVAGAFNGDLGFAVFEFSLQDVQRPMEGSAHFAIDNEPPAAEVAAKSAIGDMPVVSNKMKVIGGDGVIQKADRRFSVERAVA